MNFQMTFIKIVLLCVAFGCLSSARSTHTKLFRAKRQSADIKTLEYLARWALERPPEGCVEIGCGLVDLQISGKKKKRDGSEQRKESRILLPLLIKSREE